MYIYSLHDILAIWPIGLDEVSFQRGIRAKLGFHLTTAAEHSHRAKLDARLLCSPLLSARAEAVAGSMLPPPDPGCPVVGIRPEANPLFSSPFSRRNRTIHSSRCRAMLPRGPPAIVPPPEAPPPPPPNAPSPPKAAVATLQLPPRPSRPLQLRILTLGPPRPRSVVATPSDRSCAAQ